MAHQGIGSHFPDWLTYEPLREEPLREPLIENNNTMFHQGIGIHFLDNYWKNWKLNSYHDAIDNVLHELSHSLWCESFKSKTLHFSHDEMKFLPENVVEVLRKKR